MNRLSRILFVALAAASALLCLAMSGLWVRSYQVRELYAFGYWNNRPYPGTVGIRTADALWLGSGGGRVAIRYGYDGCGGPTWHPGGPGPQGQWYAARPPAKNGRDFDLSDLDEPRHFCGVQYATWSNDVGLVQRAIVVPHGLFTLVFAALPVLALVTRPRFARGHCPRCGYNLCATPERCPECGHVPARAEVTA